MAKGLIVTIWYNPKCGTCRTVREAVEAKGYAVKLVEYLKTPPSVEEIDQACRLAGIDPQELARKKEPVYDSIAGQNPDRAGWLRALHENPILIERPLVILGDRALVARPPERVNEIL